jgi:hypothetical protein
VQAVVRKGRLDHRNGWIARSALRHRADEVVEELAFVHQLLKICAFETRFCGRPKYYSLFVNSRVVIVQHPFDPGFLQPVSMNYLLELFPSILRECDVHVA